MHCTKNRKSRNFRILKHPQFCACNVCGLLTHDKAWMTEADRKYIHISFQGKYTMCLHAHSFNRRFYVFEDSKFARLCVCVPGKRSAEGIVQWLKRQSGPGAPVLDSVSAAAQFIDSHNITVVGFFEVRLSIPSIHL